MKLEEKISNWGRAFKHNTTTDRYTAKPRLTALEYKQLGRQAGVLSPAIAIHKSTYSIELTAE